MAGDAEQPRKPSPLDKYRQPPVVSQETDVGAVPSESLDRRDGGYAIMLVLELRSGARVALPYSYLTSVKHESSGAVMCEYPEKTVTISGRNLGPIFEALATHTARKLVESDTRLAETSDEPYIESINISTKNTDDEP